MIRQRGWIDPYEEPVDDLDLLELALRLRWHSVAARAQLVPDEIPLQDEDGLNVLHWACCNPPPISAFESLMRHRRQVQEATRGVDKNGMTPFLCACACGAPFEMLQMMVDVAPDCVKWTDPDRWTSLHYVCYRSNRGGGGGGGRIHSIRQAICKVNLILNVDPSIAQEVDANGKTALELLCTTFFRELQSHSCAGIGIDIDTDDLFELLSTLIDYTYSSSFGVVGRSTSSTSASTSSTNSNDDNFSPSILHKIVAIEAPFALLWFTFFHRPHLAVLTDQDGNTPLHLAVRMRPSRENTTVDETRVHDELDPYYGRDQCIDYGCFLAGYEPRAAKMYNHVGETPLKIASQRFQAFNTLISRLIHVDASALESLNMDDACYPYLLEKVNQDIHSVFGILKSRPNICRSRSSQ